VDYVRHPRIAVLPNGKVLLALRYYCTGMSGAAELRNCSNLQAWALTWQARGTPCLDTGLAQVWTNHYTQCMRLRVNATLACVTAMCNSSIVQTPATTAAFWAQVGYLPSTTPSAVNSGLVARKSCRMYAQLRLLVACANLIPPRAAAATTLQRDAAFQILFPLQGPVRTGRE
jgi:uncharacterized protein (DUF2236 family)